MLKLISELLCIKHHHMNLDLFSSEDVTVRVSFCVLLCLFILFSVYFLFLKFLISYYCTILTFINEINK